MFAGFYVLKPLDGEIFILAPIPLIPGLREDSNFHWEWLCPQGHLAGSGNMFYYPEWGQRVSYWRPVGKAHGVSKHLVTPPKPSQDKLLSAPKERQCCWERNPAQECGGDNDDSSVILPDHFLHEAFHKCTPPIHVTTQPRARHWVSQSTGEDTQPPDVRAVTWLIQVQTTHNMC